MDGCLNNNQIDYVLFHLGLVMELPGELKSKMLFIKDGEKWDHAPGKIVFPLSSAPFNSDKIKNVNGIPVLFPCNASLEFWHLENNSLVFSDDLFKSAFYLLSGYQEYKNTKRDKLGRFSAAESIQFKLGIVEKPIVNYYFEEIRKGFEALNGGHGGRPVRRTVFNPFSFFLTHDVDRVRLYSIHFIIYKIKEILGIRESKAGKALLLKQFATGLVNFLLKGSKKDPAWDFTYLRNIEKEKNWLSAFYFLDNETRHADADYDFRDTKMQELIRGLEKEGCEIGLHGTLKSVISRESLQASVLKFNRIFPYILKGIRQHRLRYEIPVTTEIQQECHFVYDTTLGFFDHEGFRNSFCLPFKPYNFKNDSISDIWEIPLTVMDCTLLEYRELNFQDALYNVNKLITETERFSGVFTLLWHNGYFDEIKFPGIHTFYEDLLSAINLHKPENLVGFQIIDRIESA
jgi:hypothetical protein